VEDQTKKNPDIDKAVAKLEANQNNLEKLITKGETTVSKLQDQQWISPKQTDLAAHSWKYGAKSLTVMRLVDNCKPRPRSTI
jgi:hypothetical protein